MFDKFEKDIENTLAELLKPYKCEYSVLYDAMRYSVEAGGKRIRPKIMLKFMELCGADPKDALKFACALEMIHTYSLIHDDLPCMDDDDLRRGKPSCHKAFGEANALLAGDALLTDAFKFALSTENIPAERIIRAANVLAQCAGSNGMIGGQVIDLKYEQAKPSLNTIILLYKLKTGALIKAAASIGCILAGADEGKITNAGMFAENIGLAFQIRDDILDIIGDEKTLGKPIGSDAALQKSTYVSFVGIERAQKDVDEFTRKALQLLNVFGNNTDELKTFALELCGRKN